MGLTRPRLRPGRTAPDGELTNSSSEADSPKFGDSRSLTHSKQKYGPFSKPVLALLLICSVGMGLWYSSLFLQPLSAETTPGKGIPQPTHPSPPLSSRIGASDKPQPKQQVHVEEDKNILTIYLEPTTSLPSNTYPLPRRKTSAAKLQKKTFPDFQPDCSQPVLASSLDFPIDNFPDDDPFLPWIHDYFVDGTASDGSARVKFVAQNKRRCDTGEEREGIMRFMEPQMALFQPVPVREEHVQNSNGTTSVIYRLSSPAVATAKETRFICRFHNAAGVVHTTLSEYPFNYEFVAWRKHKGAMFVKKGRDVEHFEYSQLLFYCPVPAPFRDALLIQNSGQHPKEQKDPTSNANKPFVWLDLVPIRTPARDGQFLFTPEHTGPEEWDSLNHFNTTHAFGEDHVLPAVEDSGRWANLPLCPAVSKPPALLTTTTTTQPSSSTSRKRNSNRLVACTWTAATYHRRGDTTQVGDSVARLKEWIVFHQLVGLDHIYIYDNTALNTTEQEMSPLQEIAREFLGFVTLHPWPAKICNNNRPNHKNPGERSSQYAAEASCRERYGPLTDWMAFIDTDEYLVPMRNASWETVLQEAEDQGTHVLKMRSSRGKPRTNLMEVVDDPVVCHNPSPVKTRLPTEACIVPRRNETFLRVYNCDYIRPPRPERFARAMKQIYRPAFVLSHFVHYSTITASIARYYKDAPDPSKFIRRVQTSDWGDAFLDELTQGVLVHTKSVMPHETMTRNATCWLGSKHVCQVGYTCPDSLPFDDKLHQKNVFHAENGSFCNCWVNRHLEDYLVPRLEAALKSALTVS
jgi:hypothetical protein